MHYLRLVLLAPLLLIQGILVRKRTPLLPEPAGTRKGEIGEGKSLRLLIVGDSSGAGVGVEHQKDALLGRLKEHLSGDYKLIYQLIAKTGTTTQSTLDYLTQSSQKLAQFDVVVISLGVNDITSGVALGKWLSYQHKLREYLTKQLGAQHIICSGMPPMDSFPALPQPLRWFLGLRAKEFDEHLQHAIAPFAHLHYIFLRVSDDPSLMASDGFHPGKGVYAMWAEAIAEKIKTLM